MLLTIASAFCYAEIKSGIIMKMLSDVMKVFWIKWELHGMVGFSLFLQFMLLVLGNRRKFPGQISPCIAILVWLAYLTADWVATVALSTLLKAKDQETINNKQLVVFWTPFLLLHLGGPHTISAYSLEDNELWLRSLLGLIIQVGVAVYVYTRFRTDSALTYMAIPIFIAGVIKYGERIWVLRAASRKQFSNSIFSAPRTPSLLGTYRPSQNHPMTGLPTVDREVQTLDAHLESKRVIQEGKNIHKAFCLYKMFKPLFLDLKLRIHKDLNLIDIIVRSTLVEFEDAFKLVQMELGFLYDVLYTKTTMLQSIVGVILRNICLLSTLSALIAFSTIVDKRRYPKPDIAMTYMLLTGAFFLDVFSVILHVLSNWTVLHLTIRDNKVHKFVGSRRVSWLISRYRGDKKGIASMAQHSLIDYCLKVNTSWWTKIVRFIDTEDILKKFWWTTWKPVNHELKKFIHSSLQNKHKKYGELGFQHKELSHLIMDKGKWVFESKGVSDELINWSIEDVEFSHSLLLWHIATFLLFHDDNRKYSGSALGSYCQISKQFSDYMMYLLLVQRLMLPKGIGEVRIRDTLDHVLKFFIKQSSLTESEVANALLHIDSKFEHMNQPQSKSVLVDGCKLALKLQAVMVEKLLLDHEEKWEMIADVWMEMLVFAASKCEWREHKRQLNNSEELITHVALLMAHFGLTENIEIAEGKPSSLSNRKEEIAVDSWQWDWELSHLASYLA